MQLLNHGLKFFFNSNLVSASRQMTTVPGSDPLVLRLNNILLHFVNDVHEVSTDTNKI